MRRDEILPQVLDTQQVALAVSGAPDFEFLMAAWLASLDVRPNSKAVDVTRWRLL
jgi:hypothetical protein